MKNFLISSVHDVYVDHFTEGEGQHVNTFTVDNTKVSAEGYKEAITQYLENKLYYDLCFNDCEYDAEREVFQTSCLVDKSNYQASDAEIQEWKNGAKTLYLDRAEITVLEIVNITL